MSIFWSNKFFVTPTGNVTKEKDHTRNTCPYEMAFPHEFAEWEEGQDTH
jgi:hypothetical protein